jgi:hypothetical protein
VAGALFAGARGALIAAIGVPLLGFITMAWYDRWNRVREDARLFFRVLLRSDHRERLVRERTALAAEFDALIAESRLFEEAPSR